MVWPFVVRTNGYLGTLGGSTFDQCRAVGLCALKVNVLVMVTPLVLTVAAGQKLSSGVSALDPVLAHAVSVFQVPTTSLPHAVLPVRAVSWRLERLSRLVASAPTNHINPLPPLD